MLEIVELARPTDVGDGIIRERAVRAKVRQSRQFVATLEGREAGYLSFDDRSDIQTGVIYEVFVLPKFRKLGIGSSLVAFAEELALSLKCVRLRLSAIPFDRSVTQDWLDSWYTRRGYIRASDGSNELEKDISVRSGAA